MANLNGKKVRPNLDEKTTQVLNLTVLQRTDPFVEEILMTCRHVTFYKFDTTTSQWSRKDVEGSLFVVKRNAQPRFQFIVMNRLNEENLVEDLMGEFECEVQLPYLLYRNKARDVNGIWFYNAAECEEVANLFSRILAAYSKVPQKSTVSTIKSEFEELEAVPTMDDMDGPLEPSPSTASNIADIPDDRAFVNFFSTASHTAVTGQTYQSSTISLPLHQVGFSPSAISSMHMSSHPQLSTAPSAPSLDVPESHRNTNLATTLVMPSYFAPTPPPVTVNAPVSSSVPIGPLFQPAVSLHRPHGAPLLQSFPPPAPPPSLTPASYSASNYGPVINRDKVRDALRLLVQDNQFVDMVHLALLKAHHS